MKTIESECDYFLEMVVPDTAPEVQIKSMRQAFYAGAISMHRLMLSATQDENEDVCVNKLDQLSDEIENTLRKALLGS